MRKEYIMSEEDKVLKRQKIEQNRAKKRPCSNSHKTMKMKRESIDDSNFDETCTSIPSVTSVISESYFWESDKKYTNLDANKQPSMDSMSPVTAASVPSPSSPSDNCDIVGTKTLEMLKDSSHSALSNFVKFDQSISYAQSDISIEKNSSNQINFDTNSINNYEQEKRNLLDSAKIIEPIGTSKKLEKKFQEPINSSLSLPKRSRLQDNLPDYSTFKPSLDEQNIITNIPYTECSTSAKLVESCMNQVTPETNAEDIIMCQKPKENCLKGSDLASKMLQDPELIAKLVSNPNVIAKVIRDQNLLTKFITDPEIINKLISDPQISQFLEEKIVTQNIQETAKSNLDKNAIDKFIGNGISDNMIRDMLGNDQNHVENPILTNLITNRNTEEHHYQNHITMNEWNKATDDVTRDVLQDVQR
jgi:nuclear receptor subfamily 1 group I